MKELVKTMYRCDHCLKYYFRKPACERHEKECHHNPENKRACFDCGNCVKKNVEITTNMLPNGEYVNFTYSAYHCKHFDYFVYPPKIEHKGTPFELDSGNYPMPKECEHQIESDDLPF